MEHLDILTAGWQVVTHVASGINVAAMLATFSACLVADRFGYVRRLAGRLPRREHRTVVSTEVVLPRAIVAPAPPSHRGHSAHRVHAGRH